MASKGICLAVLFVFCLPLPLPVLSVNTNINGTRGASVLWQCHHKLESPFQPQESRIYWQTQDDIVLHVYNAGQEEYEYQDKTFQNRTKIFPDQLSLGNFSLVIEPLMLRDDRISLTVVYMAATQAGITICQQTLYVAAPLQKPKVEINHTTMSANCSTRGVYPEPQISWTSQNDSHIPEHTLGQREVQTTMTHEEDGTYSINSMVSITGTMTCYVYNPTSNQTVSAAAAITEHTKSRVIAIVVPIILIIIIIIICIAVGIACARARAGGPYAAPEIALAPIDDGGGSEGDEAEQRRDDGRVEEELN
ncbi:butyrophilin subfamily 1 member A1-like [Myripristis murdjan]|uniref:butyrophilin subfamily 1 member A1-like n=1 Tax=Myripristis murdjan TaxID=586833 RepID=UPI0011763AA5|nr:butyrophilin subfamily 1 member A1-like [Myripristis murdjan]